MTEVVPADDGLETVSRAETEELQRHEATIGTAIATAGRIAGASLRQIRDRRLYRATHRSFEQYVLDRWGISRSTAYRMIDVARERAAAARTTQALNPAEEPDDERKAEERQRNAQRQRDEYERIKEARRGDVAPPPPPTEAERIALASAAAASRARAMGHPTPPSTVNLPGTSQTAPEAPPTPSVAPPAARVTDDRSAFSLFLEYLHHLPPHDRLSRVARHGEVSQVLAWAQGLALAWTDAHPDKSGNASEHRLGSEV